MIEIVLNGEKRQFNTAVNIKDLLMKLGIKPQGVVVERNARVLKKAEHAQSYISDGDTIEIVQFVGGG